MGTLQLLLVLVGVIVVGIAVVVGTNIFGSNSEQAAKDAITQDCLRIASAAEGYYSKPVMLGGGGNNFKRIGMIDCGMKEGATDVEAENINGTYVISKAELAEFEVTGSSRRNPKSMVIVSMDMLAKKESKMKVLYENW